MLVRTIKKDPGFVAEASQIAIVTLEFTILFELVLPRYSESYTADAIDALMYSLGAFAFWLWSVRQKSISTTTVSKSGV